jgi:hypothetical protein
MIFPLAALPLLIIITFLSEDWEEWIGSWKMYFWGD